MKQRSLITKDFTLYVSISTEEIFSKEDISGLVRNNTLFISLRDFFNNGGLSTVNIYEYNMSTITLSVEGEITDLQLDTLKTAMDTMDYYLTLIYVKENSLMFRFKKRERK